MTRILFVCWGNICRSPMAEVIMRDIVRDKGLENDFVIASAAISREEIVGGVGNPIYPPARRELEKRGHRDFAHRAVQMQKEDYGRFDLILGMERRHVRDIVRICGGDPAHKVRRLLDFVPGGGDIDDPWYTGDFAGTYDKIAAGCGALLADLQKGGADTQR